MFDQVSLIKAVGKWTSMAKINKLCHGVSDRKDAIWDWPKFTQLWMNKFSTSAPLLQHSSCKYIVVRALFKLTLKMGCTIMMIADVHRPF